MSDSGAIGPITVEFEASDGTALFGDLAVPAAPVGAAIVCHPHPSYGGDRFNHVVAALFEALPAAGVAALRFDFRSDFDGGRGERLDALAALDVMADRVDVPLVAVGYSFGALIALTLDDERVAATVAVAPPLAMAPPAAPATPTLVLTPAHDQFSAPAASEEVVAGWRTARTTTVDHRTIEMADHSLVGHTADVADTVNAWLRAVISG